MLKQPVVIDDGCPKNSTVGAVWLLMLRATAQHQEPDHRWSPGANRCMYAELAPPIPAGTTSKKAVASVPFNACRIVIMHNPSSFRRIPAGGAPFALAGHTHGAQIRLPGMSRFSWLHLIQDPDLPVDGWARSDYGQPGNRLYVSRGIGFSIVPIRINCPPELTLFRLRPREF